ncbi:MAG TPA: hypothetical protein VNC18_17500 [Gemmatimonadaceae bacterium]|jgi:hypothetical protein|nr:hypothetical protein [Gemmatimonadaceae bacterium]
MTGESVARFPSLAEYGAAISARTLHTESHDANRADAEVIPFPVHANGAQPYMVGLTTLWWSPLPHERTMTPLGTVCNTTIIV